MDVRSTMRNHTNVPWINSTVGLLRNGNDDVLDTSSAYLILDVHGQILYCSSAAVQLLNIKSQSIVGSPIRQLIPSLPIRDDTVGYNLAYICFWSNDTWLDLNISDKKIEARLSQQILADQSIILLEIRTSDTKAQEILPPPMYAFDMSGELVAITDAHGTTEYVNSAFEELTGYGLEEVEGHVFNVLDAVRKSSNFYDKMWSTLHERKNFRGVIASLKKNGQLFYGDWTIRPVSDENEKISRYIFIGRDVSARERYIRRLEHFANHDSLTGLPNRRLFMDRLRQSIAHATRHNGRFALFLVDLDYFKSVNDQFGHAMGDSLLVSVANRLRQCVREEDTVARLGGDEYAIILNDITFIDDAVKVLDKVNSVLSSPLEFDQMEVACSASTGVAFYPLNGSDMSVLLDCADKNMYRAKSDGGNSYFFHQQNDKHGAHLFRLPYDKLFAARVMVTETDMKEDFEA